MGRYLAPKTPFLKKNNSIKKLKESIVKVKVFRRTHNAERRIRTKSIESLPSVESVLTHHCLLNCLGLNTLDGCLTLNATITSVRHSAKNPAPLIMTANLFSSILGNCPRV